ncbi:MAG: type IV pilin, partial [Thermoplasmata archaeon]
MSFDVRKRKSWLENSGVSEVIGNILILMITVILFTGIIAFVNQMPVPEQATKADFDASISFSASGEQANLTVTHAGGASIKAKNVMILVEQDSVNKVYYLSSDPDFEAAQWSMGMSWYKLLTGTTYTSKIVVTVYDTEKDSAIWSSQVTGGSGRNPPSILQRYVDSNPTTPTADYVREYRNFTFFVKIIDNDNDLDTSAVWLDSSQIEGDAGLHRAPDSITGDGWFTWDFVVWNMTSGTLRYNASDLDGAVLFIHASDKAGHSSVSTFVMSVVILPTDVNLYPAPNPQEPQGEYGLPLYLHFDSEGQGWAVFGEDEANQTADTNDRRTDFVYGEMLYIRVGSTVMKNIMGENKMIVLDTRTGNQYWPPSASSDAFRAVAGTATAAIYEASFNTSTLIPGSFTVKVSLKSKATSDQPEVRFQADITITVSQSGNPAGSFMPKIFLFKESARTTPWGTKDSPFSLTGGTYKIYASVRVQDAQTSPSPNVEEIRIVDLRGGSELYGVPPAGSMITAMTKANDTYYNFEIDLRYNNGDMWIGGRNSYTLYISAFSDSNEGVYSLSKQVFITSAYGRSDFILGTSGVASGNGNFNLLDYLLFVENNNFFTKRAVWGYENSPSNTPDYMVTALAAGDIDSDGDKDVLMGQKTSNALYLFKNSLNLNGEWQNLGTISRPSHDTSYLVEWISFGDINK